MLFSFPPDLKRYLESLIAQEDEVRRIQSQRTQARAVAALEEFGSERCSPPRPQAQPQSHSPPKSGGNLSRIKGSRDYSTAASDTRSNSASPMTPPEHTQLRAAGSAAAVTAAAARSKTEHRALGPLTLPFRRQGSSRDEHGAMSPDASPSSPTVLGTEVSLGMKAEKPLTMEYLHQLENALGTEGVKVLCTAFVPHVLVPLLHVLASDELVHV